jgi:hypothetical protein
LYFIVFLKNNKFLSNLNLFIQLGALFISLNFFL